MGQERLIIFHFKPMISSGHLDETHPKSGSSQLTLKFRP